jgi:hypothetical protein
VPRTGLPASIATILLALLPATASGQGIYTVGAGQPHTTIQAAIDDAYVLPGDTIVVIDPVHTELDIQVTKSVTIQGLGPSSTTIQGAEQPDTATGRVFTIAAGQFVSLWNMTIRHGKATGSPAQGGGILNNGTLTVTNCTIAQNIAVGNSGSDGCDAYGGGVRNNGTLTIVDCTISQNVARGGTGTSGSGGYAVGGGICNGANGLLDVRRCLLQANQALGGVGTDYNGDGRGGGASDSWTMSGETSVYRNCTFSGNTADDCGGGFYGWQNVSLIHCTVVYNTAQWGGGVHANSSNDNTGPILANSVIACNTATSGAPDIAANIQSRGYNLIGNAAGGTLDTAGNGNTGVGNIIGGDPGIALSLADNGGLTHTYALAADSVCIDRIPNGWSGMGSAPLDVDQRGYSRPYNVLDNGTPGDIGAFELQPVEPTVTTAAVTDTLARSATGGGNVVDDGGSPVTARGLCFGMMPYPCIDDGSSVTVEAGGSGAFTSQMTELAPGAGYYVRAYATNAVGTAYGEDVEFATLADVPLLATVDATDVTATEAVCGGDLTDNGGSSISARGVAWSTQHNPTLESNEGSATSDSIFSIYSVTLTGLAPGTTYFARAFATNDTGTGYGQEVSFSTPAVLPTVTTAAVSAIGTTSATCGGEVTASGGAAVYQRGILWSSAPDITVANAQHTLPAGDGTGPFSAAMTGLTPGTTWYVRAFASNSVGHGYGQERTFTTTVPVLPTVQTLSPQDVTATSARCAGQALSDGGSAITQRGLVWSNLPEPTLDSCTGQAADGTGTGEFTADMTALSPATTYYVRAYATNGVGTAYGEAQGFTTAPADPAPASVPTVTTASVTNITSTGAQSGGTVSDDGGATVTARGVVWSTAESPTLADSLGQTSDGQGEGNFTSEIANLPPETTCYVRAYATNAVGTAYGATQTFTTAAAPVDPNQPDPQPATPMPCALLPLLGLGLLFWMFRLVTVPLSTGGTTATVSAMSRRPTADSAQLPPAAPTL